MVYAVYATERFDAEITKLQPDEQERIRKIFLQIKENPYVGDQLRYRFFREKRIKEKRMYYLVYDDLMAVIIVAINNKKTQQETIDYIINSLDVFKIYLRKKLAGG